MGAPQRSPRPMASHEYTRRAHLLAFWRGRVGMGIVSALWTVYGIFSAWRQEWLSAADQDKYLVLRLMPHLSLPWWIAVAACILALWMFESSFRIVRAERRSAHREGQSAQAVSRTTRAEKASILL